MLCSTVKPFQVALVKPVAYLSSSYEDGRSLSGFRLLLEGQGIRRLLDFESEETETDLLDVVQFLARQGIESYSDLKKWLRPEESRDSLISDQSGLGLNTRTPFKIADKTADYFRLLVSHWDAVAVDKGIRSLLAQAEIVTIYSNDILTKKKGRLSNWLLWSWSAGHRSRSEHLSFFGRSAREKTGENKIHCAREGLKVLPEMREEGPEASKVLPRMWH